MPLYTYKAQERNGNWVRGSMDASSKEHIVAQLLKMGFTPDVIKEERKASSAYTFSFRKYLDSVDSLEVSIFSLQLANMLNAGVNLLTALKTMNKLIVNQRLKDVISQVTKSVAAGEKFSVSLQKHPLIFSQVFINMVRTGEIHGRLGKVLEQYSSYTKHQAQAQKKIREDFRKPIEIFILILVGAGYVSAFVFPQFIEIFRSAGVSLSLSAQFLDSLGFMIRESGWLFIGGLFLMVLISRILLKVSKVKRNWDNVCLKLPILGRFRRNNLMAQLSRTMGVLLASGVSLLQALDVTGATIKNSIISHSIFEARQSLEKGDSFIESLTSLGQYPADVLQVIAIGEESGTLTNSFLKTADLYDVLVRNTVDKWKAFINMTSFVVVAVFVVLLVSAMVF